MATADDGKTKMVVPSADEEGVVLSVFSKVEDVAAVKRLSDVVSQGLPLGGSNVARSELQAGTEGGTDDAMLEVNEDRAGPVGVVGVAAAGLLQGPQVLARDLLGCVWRPLAAEVRRVQLTPVSLEGQGVVLRRA